MEWHPTKRDFTPGNGVFFQCQPFVRVREQANPKILETARGLRRSRKDC